MKLSAMQVAIGSAVVCGALAANGAQPGPAATATSGIADPAIETVYRDCRAINPLYYAELKALLAMRGDTPDDMADVALALFAAAHRFESVELVEPAFQIARLRGVAAIRRTANAFAETAIAIDNDDGTRQAQREVLIASLEITAASQDVQVFDRFVTDRCGL